MFRSLEAVLDVVHGVPRMHMSTTDLQTDICRTVRPDHAVHVHTSCVRMYGMPLARRSLAHADMQWLML